MNTYNTIGYMPMPVGFPFKDLFLQGRPKHGKFDAFWRKHPPMDPGHRAKIFAPFDALAGFDEAITSKEVLYEPKRLLSESEKKILSDRLNRLHLLTVNGKAARRNRPAATVTYFVPCTDKNSFAYDVEGTYATITGIVRKVDSETIVMEGQSIDLSDISEITMNNQQGGAYDDYP